MDSYYYYFAQDQDMAPIESAPMTTMPFPGNGMIPTAPGTMIPSQPSGAAIPGVPGVQVEESYIENILRLNRGKVGTFYMTFEGNPKWTASVFQGTVEAAGRDHIIISDPQTGKRYLLKMVNLDYVTFDEPINYSYPFNGGSGMSR